jgi:hypothetical protein
MCCVKKNVCRLGALIIVKFLKERCIFLTIGGGYLELHKSMITGGRAPFNLKNTFFQNRFIENMKLVI